MDGDQNGLLIPYYGTHIFIHVHIYTQPIFPMCKSICELHPQTLESRLFTHVYGTKHIDYLSIHDLIK